LAITLKEDFPEVEIAGRYNPQEIFGAGSKEIRCAGSSQNVHEEGFVLADQEFLDILQPRMVYSKGLHALDEPNTIVISKRKADKYFPNENPVGKSLIVETNEQPYAGNTFVINYEKSKAYKITGVVDFPPHSHFQDDFLISLKGFELYEGEQSVWKGRAYHTYVKLRKGTNVKEFEAKLSGIVKKFYVPDDAEAIKKLTFKLQNIRDIYIDNSIIDNLPHGDMRLLWIFGIIAFVILLIACINFVNLSTATSANKAKSTGIRKTIGSRKSNLIAQYLTESTLFSLISFTIGIFLTALLLPYFNILFNKNIEIPWDKTGWVFPVLMALSLIIGLLAGLYPALYLSSFKPSSIIKGGWSNENKKSVIRNILVISQFTASIILITATLAIHQQMSFILNKKLGFAKEQVLLLNDTYVMGKQVQSFKHELLKLPAIKSVTMSEYLPIEGTKRDGNRFWKHGDDNEDNNVIGQKWRVDYDYIKTMGMNIVEGRDFSANMVTDSNAVIVNQTMANELKLDEPIGKKITNSWETFEIIGVVEDFHFKSLKENIGSLCLVLGNSPNTIAVKINSSDMSASKFSISGIWGKFSPNQQIRYDFLDLKFAKMYDDVKRMGRIFNTFSLLAVIVACIGLFALSSFIIEQRTKEIGIRKVNGARITEVMAMLNTDFIKWVVIAYVVACPLAWYAIHKWLENYAYKAELSWWIFALAGAIAIVIALATVSWQSWRAATRNPVESLRYE
jgi:putative ABC transport system permease protein